MRRLCLSLLCVFAVINTAGAKPRYEFTGEVTAITNELGAFEARQDYAPISLTFNTTPGTRIERGRDRVLFREIKAGDRVRVWHDGGVATRIAILETNRRRPQPGARGG